MSLAAIRLRPIYRSMSTVLQRQQHQFFRLTRLCSVQNHKLCNVAFQTDLSIDKKSLDKFAEDIARDTKREGNTCLDNLIEKKEQLLKNISSLDSLRRGEEKDEELKKLLEEEGQQYLLNIYNINLEILHISYQQSCDAHADDDSTILEVSAGVGGQEAMLFASDLFYMYDAFVASKGWEIEVIEQSLSDLGGIKNLVACVRGRGVYKALRGEGGVHRVQRVPSTEKSGRLHTSTATVVIMPEPSAVDLTILEKDLKIETKTPTGPGGQNANKCQSAVRITHIPSGIVACSQEHRTQQPNVRSAMTLLRTRLYAMNYGKQEADADAVRRQQEGSRMRSEKIRTYNILQDRVTDHRWGTSYRNLPELWNGGPTCLDLIQKSSGSYDEYLFKQYLLKLKTAPRSKK